MARCRWRRRPRGYRFRVIETWVRGTSLRTMVRGGVVAYKGTWGNLARRINWTCKQREDVGKGVRGGGWCTYIMPGRSHKTIDLRIPACREAACRVFTSQQTSRAPSAERREVFGVLHESRASSYPECEADFRPGRHCLEGGGGAWRWCVL